VALFLRPILVEVDAQFHRRWQQVVFTTRRRNPRRKVPDEPSEQLLYLRRGDNRQMNVSIRTSNSLLQCSTRASKAGVTRTSVALSL